jgi:hypothetical protein
MAKRVIVCAGDKLQTIRDIYLEGGVLIPTGTIFYARSDGSLHVWPIAGFGESITVGIEVTEKNPADFPNRALWWGATNEPELSLLPLNCLQLVEE